MVGCFARYGKGGLSGTSTKVAMFGYVLFFFFVFASASSDRRAYVTVITTESYVRPAMVMGASLKAHTRRYEKSENEADYVCLILLSRNARGGAGVSALGARLLQAAGWSVRPIPSQLMNPNYGSEDSKKGYAENVHVWNYNKLWIWSLTEYDKVVYLDSDLLVIGNIDELFDRDIWTEIGAPANSTHRNFAAAPDMIPPDRFNSGVMAIRPDMEIFTDMRNSLGRIPSYNKGDQGFLNAYFDNWYAYPVTSRLPATYNFAYAFTHYEPVWRSNEADLKIVHFYGGKKPWDILKNTEGGVPALALPLIYLWANLSSLARAPTGDFEAEARYVCLDLFRTSLDDAAADAMMHYFKTIERGGKRRKRQRKKITKEEL